MLPRSALFAGFSIAALAHGASGQVPSLSHTAPQIGNPLAIELSGATPGSSVRLFFSTGEASASTPFGTLELERSGITLIASGPADPQGHFVFQQDVPPDPALAETWGHYQALVQDASAPNGWVLSEAVHLRYLGTRLYETCRGLDFGSEPKPAELHVISLPHRSVVGVLPLSSGPLPGSLYLPAGHAEPVFSSDLSLGAVAPHSDRLVIFDNFRLEVLAVLPLQGAVLHLLEGLDGQSAVVFEVGTARILWVDLATANVTDTLTLPPSVRGLWVAPGGMDQAWLGESDTVTIPGRSQVRHVDLAARQVLEVVAIGPPVATNMREISAVPGKLFVTTIQSGFPSADALSIVDLEVAPPAVQVLGLGATSSDAPTPLPDSGLFVISTQDTSAPSSGFVYAASLSSSPFELRELQQPESYYLFGNSIEYEEFHEDVGGFWALHPCCDWDGGPGALLRFSFADQTWSENGEVVDDGYPTTMALAHDAFTYQVCVAADSLGGVYLPFIGLHDVATSTNRSVPGGWGPIALRALTVP